MESRINGIVYMCDTEEAYRKTIEEEIDPSLSIIALSNDLSKVVMIPSLTIDRDTDFNDERFKGYKYYLCMTALLANPKYSEKLDNLINEYMNDVILNENITK